MVGLFSTVSQLRIRAFRHLAPPNGHSVRHGVRVERCPLRHSAMHVPALLRRWHLEHGELSLSGMWSWHLPSRCRFQVRFQFCCLRSSMEQGFPFAPGTTFWPWRFSSKDALNSRDGTPECALRAGTGVPLKWSADKSHFPRGNKWHRQIGPLLSSPLPLETARGHDDR